MLNFLLNILWLVFGGWATAISWFTSALIMVISIVGIPWARAAFNIGLLNLWPFGSQVVARETISGHDIGTGSLGFIGNVIWFIFCGWWLAAMHVFWGLLFCITLIGIPVGLQHFKLAKISFAPVGKAIVF
ncbi:YccF domain-containing protein [Pseudobdellovibrio sp. HCB154]|uniref:YccF domain-containing protein n=1 Tax=Pseudobdellovibrio sp. HCB154 TaxID=3386277 RepID=UPI0039170EAB